MCCIWGERQLPFFRRVSSDLAELLAQNENVVIANNYYSADIVGFNPGTALDRISLPDIDNVLALALVHEASLRLIPLQRSLGLSLTSIHPVIFSY